MVNFEPFSSVSIIDLEQVNVRQPFTNKGHLILRHFISVFPEMVSENLTSLF